MFFLFFSSSFSFFFLFPFVLVVISFLLLLNYCNAQYEFGFFLCFSAFSSAFCRFFNSPNETMGTRYVNDGRIGWMNGNWVARMVVISAGWTFAVDLWEGDGNCIVDFRIVVVHCVQGVISLRLLLAPAKKGEKNENGKKWKKGQTHFPSFRFSSTWMARWMNGWMDRWKTLNSHLWKPTKSQSQIYLFISSPLFSSFFRPLFRICVLYM